MHFQASGVGGERWDWYRGAPSLFRERHYVALNTA